MDKICAVIIPAYKAGKYINECIESILKQIPTENWKYEIYIGVDGCKDTSNICKYSHYYSDQNVGPYVIRNSLLKDHPADLYVYFDADDIMLDNFLISGIQAIESADIIIPGKRNINESISNRGDYEITLGGAMFFTPKVLEALGGFHDFRCASDTDFLCRASLLGLKIAKLNDVFYYRRLLPHSITKSDNTGYNSDYRENVWTEMSILRSDKQNLQIKPVTTTLSRVTKQDFIFNNTKINNTTIKYTPTEWYIDSSVITTKAKKRNSDSHRNRLCGYD